MLSNVCLTKEGDVAHYTHASRVPFILSNVCLTKEGDVAHYTHASRVPFILSNVCLTKEGDVAHYNQIQPLRGCVHAAIFNHRFHRWLCTLNPSGVCRLVRFLVCSFLM